MRAISTPAGFTYEPIELTMSLKGQEATPRKTAAYRCGAWAVHRSTVRNRSRDWKVTHIRTGLALPTDFDLFSDAVEVVRDLLRLRNDWDYDTIEGQWFQDAKLWWEEHCKPRFGETRQRHRASIGSTYRRNQKIQF